MVTEPRGHTSPFDEPAIYQINVEGRIPVVWGDRLEGMSVTDVPTVSPWHVSTLTGRLEDQAALAGVLNSLYALHLVVLSVTRIGPMPFE